MTLRSNNQQKYIYRAVPLHIRKTSLITRFIRCWRLGDSNNPTLLRCILHEYYVTSLFIEKSEKMRDDEKNREEENVGKEDGKGSSILWYAFNLRKKEEIHRESTFRGTRGTPLGEKGRKGTYKRLEYCLLWRGVVPKRGTEKESRGEFDRTIKGWQGSPARVPPTSTPISFHSANERRINEWKWEKKLIESVLDCFSRFLTVSPVGDTDRI